MNKLSLNKILLLGLLGLALVAGLVWKAADQPQQSMAGTAANARIVKGDLPPIGLFSTLPIYRNDTGNLGDMLSADGPRHWARLAVEQRHQLIALDALIARGGDLGALGNLSRLIMAQPRALSAEENVALDEWVRAGGQLLLFADPMLTHHARFPIGDRRRAQDVVLLSPILRRWGLDLHIDESQPAGERIAELNGAKLPVNQAGSFVLIDPAGGGSAVCELSADGLVAKCDIGRGSALIVADAALLETHDDAENLQRRAAFDQLMKRAFDSP